MSEVKERVGDIVAKLREERDEVKVKIHLAKMEANDEWHELENKFEHLEAKTKELAGASADASKDIGAAVKLLAGEIRDGFKSVAKHF